MAGSPCFELAREVLERDTLLDRREGRGTVRLVPKPAGLNSRNVIPDQIGVDKPLPGELRERGVENVERVCATLTEKLARVKAAEIALLGPAAVALVSRTFLPLVAYERHVLARATAGEVSQ